MERHSRRRDSYVALCERIPMIIKISNLRDGVHNLSFDENISEIGVDEPFYGNCNVEVELSKSHSQIVLNAVLTLNAKYQCDRCGCDLKSTVKTDYQMVYLFSKEWNYTGSEPEDSGNINLTYLPVDADKIDIANDVRDYALIAIPMKKLCKEDCKGLCASCGKDLNYGECGCTKDEADPRWQPLEKLRNKLN